MTAVGFHRPGSRSRISSAVVLSIRSKYVFEIHIATLARYDERVEKTELFACSFDLDKKGSFCARAPQREGHFNKLLSSLIRAFRMARPR